MALKEKLDLLPDKSGVYFFKNENGKILYVGKALSLKRRVRSYFQKGTLPPRIHSLMRKVYNLEWIITESEAEAFLLESNLIKHHHPHYNIRLRDDKSYPYIKITTAEGFPRVFLTRNPKRDGSLYFGPYANVKAAKKTLRLIQRLFPLRRCKDKFKIKLSPCLNFHIGQCSAPCVGRISKEEYDYLVKNVCLFLQGHYESLLSSLEKEMSKASDNENFERAAKLRDCIRAIQRVHQTQKVISFPGENMDLIVIASQVKNACALVFVVRDGKVIEKKHFLLKIEKGDKERDILSYFIKRYYADVSFIPPQIVIPCSLAEKEEIIRWLSEKRRGKVKFRVPCRGKKLKLMSLAKENAWLILGQSKGKDKDKALRQIRNYLNLPQVPTRIEGFDISNISGKQPTGSVVVFEEGKPKKSEYRKFKIKTVKGIDDFAMLSEVMSRRYKRLLKEKKTLPQLILIDGGKGQVSSCFKVLKELNLTYISLIGLAKGFEEVYIPHSSSPLGISQNSEALKLFQEVRDEAHRFAHSYHQKRRQKKLKESSLDKIPGVGPKIRKLLLSYFQSVEKIKKSSVGELKKIPGIGKKTAKKILDYLNKDKLND
ncbi:excinuclease ABC subunit UvrC [Patescibacteria group bacterium]|nr:excinuclease ABC subunit UvrC [Patescibacteria group bacterium]